VTRLFMDLFMNSSSPIRQLNH